MTLREVIAEASTDIAQRDAETLLMHVLGRDRAWVLAHIHDEVPDEALDALRGLVARRAAREPLQYLTGTQEFYGLALKTTRDTLIPRPETELLVETVLDWVAEHHAAAAPRIVDVGTGTGAIALALAAHMPTARTTAADISAAALAIARENAATHHLGERVRFVESDLLGALEGETFDIVVSNPPYVPLTDAPTLQREVRDYEPAVALYGGPDGLAIVRRLVRQAQVALRPGGLLAFEFGFSQSEAIQELFEDQRGEWRNVRMIDDYAGIPRHVFAERV